MCLQFKFASRSHKSLKSSFGGIVVLSFGIKSEYIETDEADVCNHDLRYSGFSNRLVF